MSVATSSAAGIRPAPRLQSRPSTSSVASTTSVGAPSRAPVAKPAGRIQSKTPTTAAASASSSTASRPVKQPSTPATPASSTTTSSSSSFMIPGKDTSSSAGKVFAKPSKEWVLPERAKPGRKVSVEEPDSKRQSQNRVSQRAHRARRTDYISTLEERLRQFENDEIHSNVRLQEVARALKADNERLKTELLTMDKGRNGSFSRTISPVPKGWEEERNMLISEVRVLRNEVRFLKDRMRDDKGLMVIRDSGGSLSVTPASISPMPIPSTPRDLTLANGLHGQRRSVADCPICPDPDPNCPCQKSHSALLPNATHNILHYAAHPTRQPDPSIPLGSTIDLIASPPPITHSCGICQNDEECLCRVLEEEDVKPIILTPPSSTMRMEEMCGLCVEGGFCACAVARGSPGISQPALPSASPPVALVRTGSAVALPLKRSRASTITKKPIWALDSGIASSSTSMAGRNGRVEAVCSGDPSNCDACRNDSFGREFCSNFFQSRDPSHSCAKCSGKCGTKSSTKPTSTQDRYWIDPDQAAATARPREDDHDEFEPTSSSEPLLLACCGNPSLCGHSTGGCSGTVIGIGGLIPGISEQQAEKETIRVDQAWKTLKAHPNAKFASLAFLADIVAQRTPSVAASRQDSVHGEADSGNGGLGGSGRESLGVIQEETRHEVRLASEDGADGADRKGKGRVVETSAVRNALRVLDTTPAPGEDDERDRKRFKKSD